MNVKYIGFCIAVAALSGCTSNNVKERYEAIETVKVKQEEIKSDKMDEQIASIPDWFLDVPAPDGKGVFGVGAGESNRPAFALKAAELQAKFELAKNFKQVVSGQERSYQDQVGDGDVQTKINILIDSLVEEMNVAGFERIKRTVTNVGGRANAYVLLRMPYEEYNHALRSLRAKGIDEKMEVAFNQLEKRLDDSKKRVLAQEKAMHDRQVQLKQLEIDEKVELRKAEIAEKARINAANKG